MMNQNTLEVASQAAKDLHNENIFELAFQADKIIDQINGQNLIVLAGLNKSGKSTCLHWLAGRTLIGQQMIDGSVHYVAKQPLCQINPTMNPSSLIPNIIHLDDKTILIDLPGFDSDSYVGKIGIPYILEAIFHKAKNIKFILVLGNENIISSTAEYRVKPFEGFFKMFNFNKNMNNQAKQMILQSVSLIITKSKCSYEDYQKNINSTIQQIKQLNRVSFNCQSAQLLQQLIKNKRIQLFREATNQQILNQPQTLSNLQKKQWNYLNLKQFFGISSPSQHVIQRIFLKINDKQQIRQDTIKLPFSNDFMKLSEQQKEQWKNNRIQRIKYIGQLMNILKKFIQKAIKQNNCHKQNIQYRRQFQELQKKIQIFDAYKKSDSSYKSIITQIKTQIKQNKIKQNIFGLQLIKKLQELYYILINQLTKSKNILQSWQQIKKALQLFKNIFSHTQKQQHLIITVGFIIARSIHQFNIISKLPLQLQDNFLQNIQQQIISIFSKSCFQQNKKYIWRFRFCKYIFILFYCLILFKAIQLLILVNCTYYYD